MNLRTSACAYRAVERGDDAREGGADAGEVRGEELGDGERLQQDEAVALGVVGEQAVVDGRDAGMGEGGDEGVAQEVGTDLGLVEHAGEGAHVADEVWEVPCVDELLGALHAEREAWHDISKATSNVLDPLGGRLGAGLAFGRVLGELRAREGLDGVAQRVVGEQVRVREDRVRAGAGGLLASGPACDDPALDGVALVALAVRGDDGVAHELVADRAGAGVLLLAVWAGGFHPISVSPKKKFWEKSFRKKFFWWE